MADNNDNVSINTLFSVVNIIRVVGIAVLSFFVFWLNSSYVSIDKYHNLEEKVFILEQKTSSSERQMESMMNMLKLIDSRISNLITPNGTVIYSDKILKMDSDIEIIKRDINYIKEYIKR